MENHFSITRGNCEYVTMLYGLKILHYTGSFLNEVIIYCDDIFIDSRTHCVCKCSTQRAIGTPAVREKWFLSPDLCVILDCVLGPDESSSLLAKPLSSKRNAEIPGEYVLCH